jgi:heme oxygenase
MKNNEFSLSFHDLLKLKTSKIHNEIDYLIKINSLNPTINDYIDYIVVMYKIITPLEKFILKFNEFDKFFPKTIIQNKSLSLILDLKNLEVDFNKINYSKLVPKINSFDEVLGCFYVIEGSSLGSQFLFNKLSSLHGEEFRHKMNYLNGLGRETFKHWNHFIESAMDPI